MPNEPKIKGGDWPELGPAYAMVAKEMPDAVSGLRQVRPMNWLERHTFSPSTQAITYPNNTVVYNKQAAHDVYERPEDLLTHELTHVRQNQAAGGTFANALRLVKDMFTSYGDRTDEQDAYATSDRMSMSRNRGDVNLPAEGLQRAKPR